MTESQTPDTDRTHTPLPFESRLVMNQMDNQGSTICAFGGYQGSPRWMMFSPHMPGDTEADAKFIEQACNSHYKLLEVAEMAGNIAHNLLEDIGGIAGGPVMSGLRKLLAHCNAAIADASK